MTRRLSLLAIVLVICGVAGELVLRGFGFGRPLMYRVDEALIWTLEPGVAYAPSYGVEYAINERGWRDDTVARGPAGRLVLALGDSVAFGQGVPFEQTFTEQLERLLEQASGTGRVEILNTAVPGYNLDQYPILLKSLGDELAPDLVLVGLCKNDVVSRGDLAHLRSFVAKRLAPQHNWRVRVRRSFAWFHVLDGVRLRIQARFGLEPPHAMAFENNEIGPAHWEYSLAALRRLAERARERGVPLVIAAFPYRDEAETGEHRFGVDPLATSAREAGAYWIDLLPAFARATTAQGTLFLDPVHPNARGHGVAARAVADFIASEPGLSQFRASATRPRPGRIGAGAPP